MTGGGCSAGEEGDGVGGVVCDGVGGGDLWDASLCSCIKNHFSSRSVLNMHLTNRNRIRTIILLQQCHNDLSTKPRKRTRNSHLNPSSSTSI